MPRYFSNPALQLTFLLVRNRRPRDPAATDTTHHRPSFEQLNYRLFLQYVQGGGRGNYSSIASSTVTDDMPSFRFMQASRFRFSVERSHGLCRILEGRIFRVDEGL